MIAAVIMILLILQAQFHLKVDIVEKAEKIDIINLRRQSILSLRNLKNPKKPAKQYLLLILIQRILANLNYTLRNQSKISRTIPMRKWLLLQKIIATKYSWSAVITIYNSLVSIASRKTTICTLANLLKFLRLATELKPSMNNTSILMDSITRSKMEMLLRSMRKLEPLLLID